MADKPKGTQRVQVKVVDVDSGQEVSSHEMVVPANSRGFGFSCCTTSSHFPPPDGPPEM